MNELEPKIEVNINGVHCVITFIKEDNLKLKDSIIRILSESFYSKIDASNRHNH